MATDLAEFVGGAIGISMMMHVSLLIGMIVTALSTSSPP
jgi:manganese transport protein